MSSWLASSRALLRALEQLGVHRDRRQRRLQVVRRHRGELLELGVRSLELGVGELELGLAGLERVGHRVEAAREVADLVLAVGRHARREVARGELAGRLRDGQDGAHDGAPQVPRAADDDGEHEHEPADAEADRQVGLRLGLDLAPLHEDALAAGHLRRQAAQVGVERLDVALVGQQVARGGRVVAGERDEGVRPNAVGLDLSVDLAHASQLARIVGDELGELARAAPGRRRGAWRAARAAPAGPARTRAPRCPARRATSRGGSCSVSAFCERMATRPASRWPVAAMIRTMSVAPSSTATVPLSISTRVVIRVRRLRRSTCRGPNPRGSEQLYCCASTPPCAMAHGWFGYPQRGYGLPY